MKVFSLRKGITSPTLKSVTFPTMETFSPVACFLLGQRKAKVPPINSPITTTDAPIQAYPISLLREIVLLSTCDFSLISLLIISMEGQSPSFTSEEGADKSEDRSPQHKGGEKKDQYSPFSPPTKVRFKKAVNGVLVSYRHKGLGQAKRQSAKE